MSNVKVSVRIRPLIKDELLRGEFPVMEAYESTVSLRESMNQPHDDTALFPTHRFTYDAVFDEKSTQKEVYNGAAREIVDNFLAGYNGCIMAYGQTGSGKTHTIMNSSGEGIIPLAAEEIFRYVQQKKQQNKENKFILKASFYQIYNETIYDLLDTAGVPLKIREQNRQIFIEGLQYFALETPSDLMRILQKGSANRIQAETAYNANSSRSHSILTLYLEQEVSQETLDSQSISNLMDDAQMSQYEQKRLFSKLMILDLAGSERAHSTEKKLQRETKYINQSLSVLGNVMQQIVQNQTTQTFIQFRDSKLTRVLQDAVGGNCKTSLISNVSPSQSCFSESLNTLKFADRAKQIKQHAVVNEAAAGDAEIKKLAMEIKRLKLLVKNAEEQVKEVESRQISEDGNTSLNQTPSAELAFLVSQKEGLVKQLESEEFREFSELLQSIKKLDEARAQTINHQEQLVQLRQQSLQQRDALLVLAARLQERETYLDTVQSELRQEYAHLRALREKVRVEGDIQAWRKTASDSPGSLEFSEKMYELQTVFADYTDRQVTAQQKWDALERQILQEQKALEERVQIVLQNSSSSGAFQTGRELMQECVKERDLLIKIFAEKVVPSLAEPKSKLLRDYLIKVREAILQGSLRQQLEAIFVTKSGEK